MSEKHLEVMIGACTPELFAALRDFLEARGFKLSESRSGEVFRLWADSPTWSRLPRGRPKRPAYEPVFFSVPKGLVR